MAISTLQSLFRDPKNRATDRDTFIQVLARLSGCKELKEDAERTPRKETEKAA